METLNGLRIVIMDGHWDVRWRVRNNPSCPYRIKWLPASWLGEFHKRDDNAVDVVGRTAFMTTRAYHTLKAELTRRERNRGRAYKGFTP